MTHLIKAESTAEILALRIRAAIASGEFTPGSPLPQEQLAERFGVSRSPLREALRLLEAEGTVVYRSNRGAIVASFDWNEIEEILDIRLAIEELLVRRAIPKLNSSSIAELKGRLQALHDLSDPRAWAERHAVFHTRLYGVAECPRMLGIVAQHMLPVSSLNDWGERVKQVYPVFYAADAKMLTACSAGDVDGAIEALREHYAPFARLIGGPLEGTSK